MRERQQKLGTKMIDFVLMPNKLEVCLGMLDPKHFLNFPGSLIFIIDILELSDGLSIRLIEVFHLFFLKINYKTLENFPL